MAIKEKDHYRSDKGLILATPRDLEVLTVCAHHTIARYDHVHELLSRQPGGPLKNPGSGLSDATVKDQIDRWRRAGWIIYERVLAGERGYVWVTKKGLHLLGLDELYRDARPPSALRFHHYWAVLDVRLSWWGGEDDQEPEPEEWIPERRLRAEMTNAKLRDPDHVCASIRIDPGPVPDAVVCGPGWCNAIEVQLSPLKPGEMRKKLEKLCRATYLHVATDKVYIYNDLHFYVPNENMKRYIERAAANLSDSDKERLCIEVDTEYQRLVPLSSSAK